MRKIIVAIDGSRHAVTIVTVIPNVAESAAVTYGTGFDPVALQGDANRGAEKTMRPALDAVRDGQPVGSLTRRGHAGPEIVA